jgi:acyl-CoA thioester hydrolase
MLHVGFATRRAAPWAGETRARLDAIAAAHRTLPRPAQAGRVIGLKRR